jgi:hypothetical protein
VGYSRPGVLGQGMGAHPRKSVYEQMQHVQPLLCAPGQFSLVASQPPSSACFTHAHVRSVLFQSRAQCVHGRMEAPYFF